MFRWALTFLVPTVIAAMIGLSDLASGAAAIAQLFFHVFVVLLVLSLLFSGLRRKTHNLTP